jgi:Tryptophan-associated transmembrane protein (Trp_oprn_chp)
MIKVPGPHRFTLGRTVGVGVAMSIVTAYAATKPWLTVADAGSSVSATAMADLGSASSLVSALALVALAAWGAILFTRGRLRRGIALIESSAAAVALVALGRWVHDRPGEFRSALAASGASDSAVSFTAWSWLAAAGLVVTLACGVIAWRAAGNWPEMGSRYDAPGTPSESQVTDLTSGVDVWKAID